MENIYSKYAELLTHYCIDVKKGDRVMVRSSHNAEPLLQQLAAKITAAGGHAHFDIAFREQDRLINANAQKHHYSYANPFNSIAMEEFEGFIFVRAPFNTRESRVDVSPEFQKLRQEASKPARTRYMERTATLEMRRTLCQFPTEASAQDAGMSLSEYEHFVFNACNLLDKDPVASWQKMHDFQQRIVDVLNDREEVHYKGSNIDVKFSTKGRTWINSDGKTNMPSGEVYTAPVEDSVNGKVTFTYPSIYMGEVAENVTLEIKDGYIEKWSATQGIDLLDKVFEIEGARRFGEAAIGTNSKIQQITKNILFDEKIGGTIHMAVGQAYGQCGGKNESAVHWDMITDMKEDGEITADGEVIYRKGKFII